MANIKSAKKRILTTKKKSVSNNDLEKSMKTLMKKVEKCVVENNLEAAKKALNDAIKKIDKAASKGIIKRNNADRKKSNLAKKVNKMSK